MIVFKYYWEKLATYYYCGGVRVDLTTFVVVKIGVKTVELGPTEMRLEDPTQVFRLATPQEV